MTGLFHISEAHSIAIHLCIRLAKQPEVYYSTRQIAEEFGFSVHHVAKVVQKLVRGGIIETVRGIQGGARLALDPATISMFRIAEALNETPSDTCLLAPSICDGKRCLIGREIRALNKQVQQHMEQTTLQEVADSLEHEFKPKTKKGS